MTSVGFFVGSYTIKMGHVLDPRGEGIVAFKLDPSTGDMKVIGKASEKLTGTNPTYLCGGFSKDVLYSVSEVQEGEVKSLRYKLAADLSDCSFELIDSVAAKGADPCYITSHQIGDAKVLYCANYSGGNTTSFSTKDNDSIELLQIITTDEPGSGHNPARQEASHTHQCVLLKDKFLLVPNLGIDRIQVYKVEEGGKLSTELLSKCDVCSPGYGPRHLVLHPTLDVAYFIQELASKIVVCHVDTSDDTVKFTKLQEVSTLPSDFTGENTTAAIRVDKTGRFVYGSNRGHDSISVFKVKPEDGTLETVGHAPTQQTPRDFAIDPSGKVMVVANQNSHSLFAYSLCDLTGMPTKINETYCGSPVAIHFLS